MLRKIQIKVKLKCNGLERGQTLADDRGQGGLACCSPQGHKKSDINLVTEQQQITIAYLLKWQKFQSFIKNSIDINTFYKFLSCILVGIRIIDVSL